MGGDQFIAKLLRQTKAYDYKASFGSKKPACGVKKPSVSREIPEDQPAIDSMVIEYTGAVISDSNQTRRRVYGGSR